MNIRYFFLCVILILLVKITQSQPIVLPLGNNYDIRINTVINQQNLPIHTAFRPLLTDDFAPHVNLDSTLYFNNWHEKLIKNRKSKIWAHLFTDDLISVREDDFTLGINVLTNIQFGNIRSSFAKMSFNTRGVELRGSIGKSFAFHGTFYETQGFFPDYIAQYISSQVSMPGQGVPKLYQDGYDYAWAAGHFSYSPTDWLNVQLGHDKSFIGHGYRSLLLSDNAMPYPFLKFTLRYKNLQYTTMFTEYFGFETDYWLFSSNELSQRFRKHGAFNYLSWKPFKAVEVGVFESTVWQSSNDSTYNNKFSADYFVPIVFYKTARFGLDDNHNNMIGINAKIRISNQIAIYAQGLIDNIEFDHIGDSEHYANNRYGFQFGIKCFDLFHGYFSRQRMYFQAEYNEVQPFTYGHKTWKQNYSHANLPLAHPLGANFSELIVIAKYEFENFFIDAKFTRATTGLDVDNINYGSNISKPQYIDGLTSELAQGVETDISHYSVTLGYIVNRRTNMQFFGGLDLRQFENINGKSNTKWVFFGLRTRLNNFYYDF